MQSMKKDEAKQMIYNFGMTVRMNQMYHQYLWFGWEITDHIARIAVGILAVLSVLFSAVPNTTAYSMGTAIAAAVVAVALNVFNLSRNVSLHYGLFQRWTDLRQHVERFDVLIDEQNQDDELPKHLIDQIIDFKVRKNQIEANEPSTCAIIHRHCQSRIWESVWGLDEHGKPVRTLQQVQSEAKRRSHMSSSAA